MATVLVDGQEIELAAGERINGIQAAARAGADIPHYCWHPGLTVVASCRMCLVETGRRDPATGEITMLPKLVPGCQTPATDGTVFVTKGEKIEAARAMVEEDLLIRHPIDCPICDKAGECALQDYHFEHGREERRADLQPFTSRRRELGDTVTLFVDRCVMCTRCVRFSREISGDAELMVVNRGAHEEIDVFPGFPLDNKLSGNVVDICPVGALGDRDFLYTQRVWFMKSHDNVCAGCSTGCSIKVEENQDKIYRLKPRENPHVNQWWMCDEGRYGWKHVHDPARLTLPRRAGKDGYENVDWSTLPGELDTKLSASKRIAVVLSPHLTVEDAYQLAKYVRGIDEQALLVQGPVPTEGEDERFPSGFTIRAEKCPNRRGVEEVIVGIAKELVTWDDFLGRLTDESFDAVWVTGGYKTDWNDESVAKRFSSIPLLIVQDVFASPLWNSATYQLPGATFAERDGSYVNHADRLQSFSWAVRPPAGVTTEGQLYWRLRKSPGLYNSRAVRDDLTRELLYFSAAAGGVCEYGIDLKVNLLAEV
ncbi:MAG TPA: 2Fe-2S iron-sulfur cluster-binding protein [Pirellulaceae bacterium]|nr:2Fe-2S iron-sulfur cluster-binding protein [Pirellulaceae bacterium]